jgi:hypothetical protein
MRRSVRACALAVTILGLSSTGAHAADLILTNLDFNGESTVYVNGQDVYLGQAYFTATVDGKVETLGAYCVDVFHDITLGALNLPYDNSKLLTYSDGVLSGTGTPINATDPNLAEEIGGLADYGLHSTDPIIKDAVQALIWEDMGAVLTGFGANGDAIQNEIADLKALDPTSDGVPNTIYAANGLTQGFTTGVPEPGAWALILFGFFGLGTILRASRRTRLTLPTV